MIHGKEIKLPRTCIKCHKYGVTGFDELCDECRHIEVTKICCDCGERHSKYHTGNQCPKCRINDGGVFYARSEDWIRSRPNWLNTDEFKQKI